jgi:hypothetical protein
MPSARIVLHLHGVTLASDPAAAEHGEQLSELAIVNAPGDVSISRASLCCSGCANSDMLLLVQGPGLARDSSNYTIRR